MDVHKQIAKPNILGCNSVHLRAKCTKKSVVLAGKQVSQVSSSLRKEKMYSQLHPHTREVAPKAVVSLPALAAAAHNLPSPPANFEEFAVLASEPGVTHVPLLSRIFSDQLTPVIAYRCLVGEDDTDTPSFLLESVVNDQQGRFSFVGARPLLEVMATQGRVVVLDHDAGTRTLSVESDPMEVAVRLSRDWIPARVKGLPQVFTGGWVGYAGYDTVRYVYASKLPFKSAPQDDRNLPDLHLALYNDVVVFDNATKINYAISWVEIKPEAKQQESTLQAAYAKGKERLARLAGRLKKPQSMSHGSVGIELALRPTSPGVSNMTKEAFLNAVKNVKEYILAGDIFQLVLSQRFERRTFAMPFEVYRSLRVVNPSPYMAYIQARGAILVSSSPEILCKVDETRVVTNRPLAGTRPRGRSAAADAAMEEELLADEKERAEHVMLVDLGRNDVGRVAEAGSVEVKKLMEVERYSHVMHISSTVTGTLKTGLDVWDALRAALPAGTVSGAPKVRAMQIIDELEVSRRGPYGGGFGFAGFTGTMDMALGLRTMVVQTASLDNLYSYDKNGRSRREWLFHLQAGAGIVADSVPEAEYEETVNKAAGLGRAIDLAEQAFVNAE